MRPAHRYPYARMYWRAALAASLAALALGCPVTTPTDTGTDAQTEYDRGFDDGFLEDDWYWDGFYDSYDTEAASPIYYEVSEIPYIEEASYDAGYWDGVWYAYNDGYFTSYRYAFIIGFSEGYDSAYWSDYLDFLASDVHKELRNGGWADGYNDGFSEGRVFGAYDFEADLSFDWEDALADYESGTDLYFEEVDVGTGALGPVILYEHGVDPTAAKALPRTTRSNLTLAGRSLRSGAQGGEKAIDTDLLPLYRSIPTDLQSALGVAPAQAARAARDLRLTATWLERLNSFLDLSKAGVADGASATP